MTKFEQFKEEFDNGYNNIDDFIDDVECGKKPFNAELKSENTKNISDSYDFTDEILTNVYYFPKFDIFVEFKGRNQSYSGRDWDSMKEVKLVIKTVNEFEPVNN